jgi:hypothetical protein
MKKCAGESFSMKPAEICLNSKVSNSSRITILHEDAYRDQQSITETHSTAFYIEERAAPPFK